MFLVGLDVPDYRFRRQNSPLAYRDPQAEEKFQLIPLRAAVD
jgi:hypothetical protein